MPGNDGALDRDDCDMDLRTTSDELAAPTAVGNVDGRHTPVPTGGGVAGVQRPDADVLVAPEVARLLRMNVKTVYELAKAGDLPCWRLGRHFRFSRRAIVARLRRIGKGSSHADTTRRARALALALPEGDQPPGWHQAPDLRDARD